MKKKIIGLTLGLLLVLGGCGKDADGSQETGDINSVEIKKSGMVINTIEGPFDKEYYEEDSLKEFIQEEVDTFNETSDGGSVALKKLKVKGERADIILQFDSAQEYSAFNHKVFYYGKVEDAADAGYDLSAVIFKNTDNLEETVDLEAVGGRRLVVTDEDLTLQTSGDILYVSDNTLITDTKEADTPGSELAYVIYK